MVQHETKYVYVLRNITFLSFPVGKRRKFQGFCFHCLPSVVRIISHGVVSATRLILSME